MSKWRKCQHQGCQNRATEIYGHERYGSEFTGQTHDCCGRHNERLLTKQELYGGEDED
jgi:hypothetical protein